MDEVIAVAFDILQTILAEEETAAKVMVEATQSANETVKNAEALTLEQERQAAIHHRNIYQNLLEERKQQVQAYLAAKAQQQEEAITGTLQLARDHLDLAANTIMGEVLHGHR